MSATKVMRNVVHDHHTEQFNLIIHKNQEARKNTKQEEVLVLNSLTVDFDTAYIAYPSGRKEYKKISELQGKIIFSERIELDHTVFGSDVIGLQKISDDISDKLCDSYEKLQNSLGLTNCHEEVNTAAEILFAMKTLFFGCTDFPTLLVGRTLQKWVKNDSRLEKLYISRRNNEVKTAKIIREIVNYSGNHQPFTHIWNATTHNTSLYHDREIDGYLKQLNEKTSDVNMYIIFSEDKERLAVLSISEYVMSIHFGSFHNEFSAESLLKTAFSEVTDADFFYEIDKAKIEKLRNARY